MNHFNPQDGCTVVLEDHGQDFLEFDIVGKRIVATRPFQGGVWNGKEIENDHLAPGDTIRFGDHRSLNYPVAAVRTLKAAPDDLVPRQTERAISPYTPRDKGRDERHSRPVAQASSLPEPAGRDACATCNDGLAVPEKCARVRTCMCCRREFLSQGPHNRLCTPCRGKSVGPYDLS